MVDVCMVRLAPGPLGCHRASYSRSGCTQFRPEIFDFDTCLVTCCIFNHLNTCSFFIEFHVLALPGFSRVHHNVRLETSVPTAPISSSVITVRCRLYMVNDFSWTKNNSCPPGISGEGVQPGYLWLAYGQPMVRSVPYVSMPDP
jgi:hypothetical protein